MKLLTSIARRLAGGFKSRATRRVRVLIIDDRVPYLMLGAGSPRCRQIVNALTRHHAAVSFLATIPGGFPDGDSPFEGVVRVLKIDLDKPLVSQICKYVETKYYDILLVSRPHNMKIVNECLDKKPDMLSRTTILYDAEAIFSYRKILKAQYYPVIMGSVDGRTLVQDELKIARHANLVISVSKQEADVFRLYGSNVAVLGHVIKTHPQSPSFDARSDFLFVGEMGNWSSPNTDSIIWFVDQIFPIIRVALPQVRLYLVGRLESSEIKNRLCENIISCGEVFDLQPIYDRAKVFVGPTRFAAGVPFKIIEASAQGLPCVITDLLLNQLEWKHKAEALSASNAEEFASHCIDIYSNASLWRSIRSAAFNHLSRTCSEETFNRSMGDILQFARYIERYRGLHVE